MRHFGLEINTFTFPGIPPDRLFAHVVDIAVTAEESGFHSVWVPDHVHQGGHAGVADEPILETFCLLGAIAARTTRVNVGTLVAAVGFRNPALVAKIATTLDVISSGRAILGFGAGWNESEHRAYGFDFPPLRERFDRLEEALCICRSMFTQERSEFDGRFFRVKEAVNAPRPVQPGGPPILVGGNGERRTLPLVARYADMCNFPKHTYAQTIPRKLDLLDRLCEREGRDPASVVRTRNRTLLIAPGRIEAARKASRQRSTWKADRKAFRGMVAAGNPDSVADQVRADLDLGFDGVVVSMPDVHDLDLVALAGQTLTKLL